MIGCWLWVVGRWYLVARYCLPDSRLSLSCNPETSSRVTLAALGIGFQPNLPTSNKTTKQRDDYTTKQLYNKTTIQQDNKTTRQQKTKQQTNNMAIAKWIGAFLGGLNGGIIGALAGYALGALLDKFVGGSSSDEQGNADYRSSADRGSSYYTSQEAQMEGARNGFLFSLLVLSAHVIQADGKIMHSEMNYLRAFLRRSFGEIAVKQGESIILRLFEYRKSHGDRVWESQMQEACRQMRDVMPEEHRLQLLAFLCEIAKADGIVHPAEVEAIYAICNSLGFSATIVDQFLSLGGSSIEDAYKVLGISPSATDEEVRRAYRDLVRKNHPDRVATLGDDVREAAKKKMQEINEAKERIYKERGM